MTAKETLSALLSEMESFVSSKTVVGDPVHIEETIILPLVDVTFGVGAGANEKQQDKHGQTGGAGGLGAKIQPSAVLVIKDGQTKLVNIKKQDTVTKLIDMVPDVIERFTGKTKEEPLDPEVSEKVEEMKQSE
ncbi:GerW family sporulation protein [Vallitalea okinawensis]|uniref:GerW family sporulation protein n=1 Tax=Vallitalea okinawensis TaxID=2078660 RepID=UPI000CFD34D0|nr:GerW family sporulation protein [Vallitalea okinawensis]